MMEQIQMHVCAEESVAAAAPDSATADPGSCCNAHTLGGRFGAEEEEHLLPEQPSMSPPSYLPQRPSPSPTGAAKSLAHAPTTPRIACWLIPLCALFTHGLFIYGQIEPMWRLTQYQSINIWWNATTTTSRWAYDTLGLPHELNIALPPQHEDTTTTRAHTIQTFTYSFAITELWAADGMPGSKLLPRIAAVLLTLFSGIWPHLKLILLQWTWMARLSSARRTRMLHWLATLGKWSLADILVVCVMVGVLHMDWIVDPDAIRLGIAQNLPQMLRLVQTQYDSTALCSMLLSFDCTHPDHITHRMKCDACSTAVNTAFWKADWTESTGKTILNGIATSGDGLCELRVIGMRGIYAFCLAVIASILLSLLVDLFDHWHRSVATTATMSPEAHHDEERSRNPVVVDIEEAGVVTNYTLIVDDEDQDHDGDREGDAPLLEGAVQSSWNLEPAYIDDNDDETTVRVPIRWFCCTHGFFSVAVLILSIFATTFITLERHVHGAIPMLLHDILGVEWSQSYSLHTLSLTTGSAGGWDILLMTTFSLFCVMGPVLRSALSVIAHFLQLFLPSGSRLISMICGFMDLLGAFCAWEVFVIAVAMIGLLMPSITSTILMDQRCAQVDPTGTCFEVEFQVLQTFGLVVAAGVLLLLVSNSFFLFTKKQTPAAQRSMTSR